MIFSPKYKLDEWHPKFAWIPVYVGNDCWAWLTQVQRKRNDLLSSWSFAGTIWDYRLSMCSDTGDDQ